MCHRGQRHHLAARVCFAAVLAGYGNMVGATADAARECWRQRETQMAHMRGAYDAVRFNPQARLHAVRTMQAYEAALAQANNRDVQPTWAEIGPAPIALDGDRSMPVTESGRVTAIAVHPVDPEVVFVGTAGGGVYRSLDGGAHWVPLMDDALSLVIGAIAIAPSDPRIVYVGTGEPNFTADSFFGVGMYRIDAATSAAPRVSGPYNVDSSGRDVFSGRGIGAIRVAPGDANTVFVGTTSGVGGVSAVQAPNLPERGLFRIERATTAAPRIVRLTALADNADVNVRDLVLDPLDASVLIASVTLDGERDGLYRTGDALSAMPRFDQVHALHSNSLDERVAVLSAYRDTRSGPAVFYAAVGSGGGAVLRSEDGGLNWSTRATPGFCAPRCAYAMAIAVSPNEVERVYLGGSAALTFGISDDGAGTFVDSAANLHANTHAIAVAPSRPSTIYVGTDGGIYRSDDAGMHWRSLNNSSFSATQMVGIATHPVHPNALIGGTQGTGAAILRGDNTWALAEFGDTGRNAIDQNAVELGRVRVYQTLASASERIGYWTIADLRDARPGAWTYRGCDDIDRVRNGIACLDDALYYPPLELGSGAPNPVYFGTDVLYRSTNFGATHRIVSQNPLRAGVPISAIAIAPADDDVRIVGLANGSLFRTIHGDSQLREIDGQSEGGRVPDAYIGDIAIDPVDRNLAYVALAGYVGENSIVWKTKNLRAEKPQFQAAALGLPNVPANALLIAPQNPREMYVGTDIGVYRSLDAGATWLPYSAGLPRVPIFDLAFQAAARATGRGPLRAATHGRGVWEIDARALPAERVFRDGFEGAVQAR